MTSEVPEVYDTLVEARKALQRGDRHNARKFAEKAVLQAPGLEEPWLILAALAPPQSSVNYLKKALSINPESELARQGMHWAINRLREEKALQEPAISQDDIGLIPQDLNPILPESENWQTIDRTDIPSPEDLQSTKLKERSKYRSRAGTLKRMVILPVLLVVACLAAGVWAVWPGNATHAQAFLRENPIPHDETQALPAALGMLPKPSYTPTPTATFTPTPTSTPTPTVTNTPIPTDTPPPTDTPWPTVTYIPPTQFIPGGDGERWIDVNLSQQMVYAFEGNIVINSFLVSTGTWLYPTVTGQFHIYVKYLYTDMSGPGYYLPDVPYTMYFYEGYALHGTYWHSNFGVPMSHGCVNLSIPDAGWLFNWASVGTLVNIHY